MKYVLAGLSLIFVMADARGEELVIGKNSSVECYASTGMLNKLIRCQSDTITPSYFAPLYPGRPMVHLSHGMVAYCDQSNNWSAIIICEGDQYGGGTQPLPSEPVATPEPQLVCVDRLNIDLELPMGCIEAIAPVNRADELYSDAFLFGGARGALRDCLRHMDNREVSDAEVDGYSCEQQTSDYDQSCYHALAIKVGNGKITSGHKHGFRKSCTGRYSCTKSIHDDNPYARDICFDGHHHRRRWRR